MRVCESVCELPNDAVLLLDATPFSSEQKKKQITSAEIGLLSHRVVDFFAIFFFFGVARPLLFIEKTKPYFCRPNDEPIECRLNATNQKTQFKMKHAHEEPPVRGPNDNKKKRKSNEKQTNKQTIILLAVGVLVNLLSIADDDDPLMTSNLMPFRLASPPFICSFCFLSSCLRKQKRNNERGLAL